MLNFDHKTFMYWLRSPDTGSVPYRVAYKDIEHRIPGNRIICLDYDIAYADNIFVCVTI